MLKKKYLFVTNQQNKSKKYLFFFLFIVFIFLLYSVLSFSLIYYAQVENEKTYTTFYKKSPDLIVVLTGDTGRIDFAVKKAHEFNVAKLYISGVYKKNSIETIIKEQVTTNFASGAAQNLENFTEIDYMAQNTIENIVQTLNYIRENKDFKKILIISSDYHLLRINLTLHYLMRPNDDFDFYYLGSPTELHHFRNIKIIYRELFKLVRTLLFISIWDNEV